MWTIPAKKPLTVSSTGFPAVILKMPHSIWSILWDMVHVSTHKSVLTYQTYIVLPEM